MKIHYKESIKSQALIMATECENVYTYDNYICQRYACILGKIDSNWIFYPVFLFIFFFILKWSSNSITLTNIIIITGTVCLYIDNLISSELIRIFNQLIRKIDKSYLYIIHTFIITIFLIAVHHWLNKV